MASALFSTSARKRSSRACCVPSARPQDVQLADEVEPAHEQRPGEGDPAAQRQKLGRGERRAAMASWWTPGTSTTAASATTLPWRAPLQSPVSRPSGPSGGAARRLGRRRRPVARRERHPQEGQRPGQVVEPRPIRARRRARGWRASRRRERPPSRARALRRAAATRPRTRAAARAALRAGSAAAG